jgi:hypothetical protein
VRPVWRHWIFQVERYKFLTKWIYLGFEVDSIERGLGNSMASMRLIVKMRGMFQITFPKQFQFTTLPKRKF